MNYGVGAQSPCGEDIFARKYMHEQEIIYTVTNLITPRAYFSPTYLLHLVELETTTFGPSTPKTPPYHGTKHGVNRMIRCRDFAILNCVIKRSVGRQYTFIDVIKIRLGLLLFARYSNV